MWLWELRQQTRPTTRGMCTEEAPSSSVTSERTTSASWSRSMSKVRRSSLINYLFVNTHNSLYILLTYLLTNQHPQIGSNATRPELTIQTTDLIIRRIICWILMINFIVSSITLFDHLYCTNVHPRIYLYAISSVFAVSYLTILTFNRW